MKNILITGGTGFIGQELRMLLLQQGHYITVITRNPKKYKDEAAKNQQFISWEDDLTEVMNTVDAVIHLAGESIFSQRWNEEVKQRIYDSRIDSTRQLVEAMKKAESKPGVFVSASASGFYGNQGDNVLDESNPVSDDFLAQVCKDWEEESQKAAEFSVRVVNPRIGIVLEKNGGALEKMLPPFRFGVGGPVGDGKQYMSWIHRTDLCNALIYPIEHEEIEGAYNVCAPNPVDMNEFAETLASVINRPNIFRVPKLALQVMYGEGAKPITDSIRMQPKKLQVNEFEFRFEELEEALADILE
ncbi:MAG: TIGR01777 family oxidoreductase [Balneolaceae bacterium]|nr:TIGR01777 family oxidoreductase [Balneolaceae bacterium]MBO6547961.1 TIGR01777 family oxidoreductase [Balneolaceae bacterium]MBO6648474.1 TIGR01777 family oxidoreductase [Balneolaceae bacterium]